MTASIAPVPIDPTNLQWLVHQAPWQLIAPNCLNPAQALDSEAAGMLGDNLLATNRCIPSYEFNVTLPGFVYFAVVPENNTIVAHNCYSDPTCRANCTVVAQFSTLNTDPCTPSFFTGVYSSKNYTDIDLWSPPFSTKTFSYWTTSIDAAHCFDPYAISRRPVYPTCTKIFDGLYGLTTADSMFSDQINQLVCVDAGCRNCSTQTFVKLTYQCPTVTIHSSPPTQLPNRMELNVPYESLSKSASPTSAAAVAGGAISVAAAALLASVALLC
ncbi:uncharacterized protein BJ171DRAFT_496843 [Polychytrium aggregatum]|uniref:uncharacterized protein n=1 Tax=Polychytrium aggregatum TaxID=110093 RepID=UPI0022FE7B8A|nr:uncharacterized protein BJ171DRAFT_496843 [Polychytrium aggregatum]KAI9206760.1 hypothetical protein BJ171DRAFT_496843 [Polychytrium aggregatum]